MSDSAGTLQMTVNVLRRGCKALISWKWIPRASMSPPRIAVISLRVGCMINSVKSRSDVDMVAPLCQQYSCFSLSFYRRLNKTIKTLVLYQNLMIKVQIKHFHKKTMLNLMELMFIHNILDTSVNIIFSAHLHPALWSTQWGSLHCTNRVEPSYSTAHLMWNLLQQTNRHSSMYELCRKLS